MNEALFFGCWNGPGHFLVGPGRRSAADEALEFVQFAGADDRCHIDGALAPRRMRDGSISFVAAALDETTRRRMDYDSSELPQGKFLRHVLPNGYTAISFWDRNQGDKRGACNSTFLLRGEHTSEVMLTEFRKHFPHVVENLDKAGVALVEVFPTRAISTP